MNYHTLLAYATVAALAIVTPGPAILLALRNSLTYGARSAVWSSLGNISGVFCVSAAAMVGLGVMLKSSATLFAAVKILGALYLFYIGIRHLFGHSSAVSSANNAVATQQVATGSKLYREALLVALTNPKAVLFFTALFPQFIDTMIPLLPQFFVLTGIFMVLSFLILMVYALLGARTRAWLIRPAFAKWINRIVGAIFVTFGAMLLVLRRPVG